MQIFYRYKNTIFSGIKIALNEEIHIESSVNGNSLFCWYEYIHENIAQKSYVKAFILNL